MPGRACHGWLTSGTLTLALGATACGGAVVRQPPAGTYLVTNQPIGVGQGIRSCIAVGPSGRDAVWWWQSHWSPASQSCDCRSTGPVVFKADEGIVAPASSGERLVRFRLGTHSATEPFLGVELRLVGGVLIDDRTQSRADVVTRSALDIPECR